MNRFLVLFTKRTHRTNMQTFILNMLICRKPPMKNFPKDKSFGRRNIWRPNKFTPTTENPWIQEKSPSWFKSETTRLIRIQLGISCTALTMIWLKRWGICCKDNGIFQSAPVQNWETVSELLAPSDNPAIFAKEIVDLNFNLF